MSVEEHKKKRRTASTAKLLLSAIQERKTQIKAAGL